MCFLQQPFGLLRISWSQRPIGHLHKQQRKAHPSSSSHNFQGSNKSHQQRRKLIFPTTRLPEKRSVLPEGNLRKKKVSSPESEKQTCELFKTVTAGSTSTAR